MSCLCDHPLSDHRLKRDNIGDEPYVYCQFRYQTVTGHGNGAGFYYKERCYCNGKVKKNLQQEHGNIIITGC